MGPAYATQRQEALAALTDLMKVLPPERAAMIADLFAGNIDAKDMDRAAARLKAMLPPEVLKGEQEEGASDPEDQLAEAQQQITAMQQQMEQAQQATQLLVTNLQEMTKKANDQEAERELKWKIALLNAEVAMDKADKENSIKKLELRVRELGALIDAKAEDEKPEDDKPKGDEKDDAKAE